jgi:hypothetical protein
VREKRPAPGGVEELDDDELVLRYHLREVARVQRQHRLLFGARRRPPQQQQQRREEIAIAGARPDRQQRLEIDEAGWGADSCRVLASALETWAGRICVCVSAKNMAPAFSFFLQGHYYNKKNDRLENKNISFECYIREELLYHR